MTKLGALHRIALALAVTLVGCGGPMSKAMHAFDESRYPDAVTELRALEGDAASWSTRGQARYALYRGLTHLAVGDAREATRWLARAERAAKSDPSTFDAAEHGRLGAAWRSMGVMPGEPMPAAW